jgi:hypothetical protein
MRGKSARQRSRAFRNWDSAARRRLGEQIHPVEAFVIENPDFFILGYPTTIARAAEFYRPRITLIFANPFLNLRDLRDSRIIFCCRIAA